MGRRMWMGWWRQGLNDGGGGGPESSIWDAEAMKNVRADRFAVNRISRTVTVSTAINSKNNETKMPGKIGITTKPGHATIW